MKATRRRRQRNTVEKRSSLAEYFPQQQAETIDVEFLGFWHIYVIPILRWNMCHSATTAVASTLFK